MGCAPSATAALEYKLDWKPTEKSTDATSSAAKSFGAIGQSVQVGWARLLLYNTTDDMLDVGFWSQRDLDARHAEGIDTMERVWVRRLSGTIQKGSAKPPAAGWVSYYPCCVSMMAMPRGWPAPHDSHCRVAFVPQCCRPAARLLGPPPAVEPASPPPHKASRDRPCSRLPGTCADAAAKGELSVLQVIPEPTAPVLPARPSAGLSSGGPSFLSLVLGKQLVSMGPDLRLQLPALIVLNSLSQWLRTKGCDWDSETCAAAARSGHFDVLSWAATNGCPWGATTCAAAAGRGDLPMLQWLRAHGEGRMLAPLPLIVGADS